MTKFLYCDVLVVGAGPSGLTTALSAVRQGATVIVVERHSGTSIHPRALGVTTRSMEVFRGWGLEADIRAAEIDVSNLQTTARTLPDPQHTPSGVGYPTAAETAAVSPTAPAYLPQDSLEPILVDHFRRLGGDIRFETEFTELRAAAGGAWSTVRNRRNGLITHIHARFVVGADGTRSTVRNALGIDTEHLGTLGEFSQVLFRADLDHLTGGRRYFLYAIEHPDATGLLLPVGGGRWTYVRKWIPPHGDPPTTTSHERWTQLIRIATDMPDLRPEIHSVLPFSMSGDVASTFRSGPGFLVGDAAHRMTPMGGVGMNTGIHDGHNLGWKLAWASRGWAGEGLLDSYSAERRPVGLRNALTSLNQGAQQAPAELVVDLGTTYRSSVITGDGADPAASPESGKFAPSGRPGERAPHRWTRLAGRRVSTLDLFDGRLTLLTGSSSDAWRRAFSHRNAMTGGGAPLTMLAPGHELADPDGQLELAFDVDPGGAVLVRPDGHIAWRSSPPHGHPADALRSAIDTALGLRTDTVAVAG